MTYFVLFLNSEIAVMDFLSIPIEICMQSAFYSTINLMTPRIIEQEISKALRVNGDKHFND